MSLKKILFLAGSLVLLVGVGSLLLNQRSRRELERWRLDARQRGEKLTLRELELTQASNALDYQRRFTSAVGRLQFTPVAPSAIELMRTTAVGRAQLAWRQPTPTDEKTTANTWENLTAQVDEGAGPLAELHRLLGHWPRGLQWDPNAPFTSPTLSLIAARKAAQFLTGAAVVELRRDRLDVALTNIHSLIALSQLTRDGGTLVEGMVGVAIAGLAHAASWEALQAPGWDEGRLLALQAALQKCDLIAAHVRTVETERAYGLAWFEFARRARRATNNLLVPSVGFNSTHPIVEGINQNVFNPIWRLRWSYQDELLYLRRMQPTLEATRRLTNLGSWNQWRTSMGSNTAANAVQKPMDSFRYPMNEMAIPSIQKAARYVLRAETRRHMLLAVLALKRFQLRQGRLPRQLEELLPEFLPAWPRDFVDGGGLHYQPGDGDAFSLYSIGENGRDEQGGGDDLSWPGVE